MSDRDDGSADLPAGMRVAYLVNQYPKISHTFIRREILALERRGIEVRRFALRGWDAEVVDPADIAEKQRTRHVLEQGVPPLIAALMRCAIRKPGPFWRAFRAALTMARRSVRPWPFHLIWLAHACRLSEWLAEDEVSHIHAHFGTNPADIVYLLRLLGGPDYSFTVHGSDETDNAGNLNLDRKIGAAKFAVAISSYTRSQLLRHLAPSQWDKVNVVHCGLEQGSFAEAAPPFPGDPVFLCIGRLSGEKGHLVLLEAFAKISRDHPTAQLVLAGDGDLRNMIEARIEALGLHGRVTVTGWISGDEVQRLIVASTVIVQPSLMEGLPVVIMEAMAQYRPVISTYIAGIPELVRHGETGWLVPAGEVGDLAEAMAAALQLPGDDLRGMGAAGAMRVRARHDIDVEAGRLACLFAK